MFTLYLYVVGTFTTFALVQDDIDGGHFSAGAALLVSALWPATVPLLTIARYFR